MRYFHFFILFAICATPAKAADAVCNLNRPAKDAIAACSDAIAKNAKNADFYVARGGSYATVGDYDKALADLDRAIDLDPKRVMAYFVRGSVNFDRGDYDRAIADYSIVVFQDPNDTLALQGRGDSYSEKQDYDRALADYDKAIALSPKDGLLYLSRGMTLRRKGEHPRAIADLDKAVAILDKNAQAYFQRAYAHLKSGAFTESIADTSRAIDLDPNNAFAYALRAEAQFGLKARDQAISDAEKAVQLAPNVATYKVDLAKYKGEAPPTSVAASPPAAPILSAEDKALLDDCSAMPADTPPATVVANCTKAIAAAKFNGFDLAKLFVYRGLNNHRSGFQDEALADTASALKIEPKYAAPHLVRAFVFRQRADRKTAIAETTTAIELDARYTRALIERSDLYYEQGDVDLAKTDAQAILKYSPDDATAKKLLLKYQGPEARLTLAKKYLETDPRKAIDLLKSIKDGETKELLMPSLTVAYEYAGEHDKALAEYDRWISTLGGTAGDGIKAYRAAYFIRTGKFNEGIADLVAVNEKETAEHAKDPKIPRTAPCRIVWAYYLKGDVDRAASELSKFSQASSPPPNLAMSRYVDTLLYRLAGGCEFATPLILAQQGKMAEALNYVRGFKVEKLDQDAPLALFARGVVFEANGDLGLAYLEYSRYLRGDIKYWDEKHFAKSAEARKNAIAVKLGPAIMRAETDCRDSADAGMQVVACPVAFADDPKKGWPPIGLGRALEVLGRKADAVAAYTMAIEADRSTKEAYVLRGKARVGGPDDYEANEDFDKALSIDPAYPDALIAKAMKSLADGAGAEDLRKMMVEIEKIARAFPDSTEAQLIRGELGVQLSYAETDKAEKAKRLDAAAKDFGAASYGRDKSIRSNLGLSNVAWARSDWDESLRELDRALEKSPSSIEARSLRAVRRAARGNFTAAIADYTQLIDKAPLPTDSITWRRKRAEAYAAAKQFEPAESEYTTLIAEHEQYVRPSSKPTEDPMDDLRKAVGTSVLARLYELRGKARLAAQRPADAEADFRSAIGRASANKGSAQFALGTALMAQAKCELAKTEMTAALVADKKAGELVTFAVAQLCAGDLKAAVASLLPSVQRENPYAYGMVLRYIALARSGEKAAVKDFEANAARLKDTAWPYPIVEMILGKRDPDAVPLAAADKDQMCEANYYVAAWRALKGDFDAAKAGYKQAADECRKDFYEYPLAVIDLQKLKN